VLRETPDDFEVTERLGFEPSGDGPHALLLVQKRGLNTLDLIAHVAAAAELRPREIGYCGLKDRHALTRQWLSVPAAAAAAALDWGGDDWSVLEVRHNRRKLRLGAHRGNAFVLRIRHLDGDTAALPGRIAGIAAAGVPNYFGPQRFGQGGDNLRRARRWFVDGVELGRRQRRFALSAARSWLFNRVLAARVAAGHWQRLLPGEPVSLDGSRSYFMDAGDAPQVLQARLASLDVHPSGPLWGAGESVARDECARFEAQASAGMDWLRDGLAQAGLRQERRALRLRVAELEAALVEDTLELRFELGRGAFATSVVHELVDVQDLTIPA
jgi:tRNA pseudouridine13 synthase